MNKTIIIVIMVFFIASNLISQEISDSAPAGFVKIPGGAFLMGSPDTERFRIHNE